MVYLVFDCRAAPVADGMLIRVGEPPASWAHSTLADNRLQLRPGLVFQALHEAGQSVSQIYFRFQPVALPQAFKK
jgi:hypothetical protein